MQIKLINRGTTLIACLIGELDHHTVEYVRKKIDGEMMKSTTQNIIFDFSKVEFMDSSGIGTIIGRYNTIRRLNGKAAIVNPNPQVRRILEMSGLLKIIPVCDSIDNANNYFGMGA